MPVLLSLQSLGVAPGDVHLSSRTKTSMRVWRIVVWFAFLAYGVIFIYNLISDPVRYENDPDGVVFRLEVADVTMVFVAAVTANLLHNSQRVSFLKIVHTLNEMGTQSQIRPQSDLEGSRCFLMSLMNLLCHIGGAAIYLVFGDPMDSLLECTESVIRILLLSTTLLLQVISAGEICWSFTHYVQEINRLLMRRANVRILLEMRVCYTKMITTVRDINRIYTMPIGIAFIHAAVRAVSTVKLFLKDEMSALVITRSIYEFTILLCLVVMCEASNSLRVGGTTTASLVTERISEYREAPHQMSLLVQSLKRQKLQLKLFGFISISRLTCTVYFLVLFISVAAIVLQDKDMLSGIANFSTV